MGILTIPYSVLWFTEAPKKTDIASNVIVFLLLGSDNPIVTFLLTSPLVWAAFA